MAWTKQKRVCKALYFSLQRAEQIDIATEFEDAGSREMKELLFFNQHISADLLKQEALMLAFRLNDEFIEIYKATYEEDETDISSIAKMIGILIKADKTVEDLSDTVDGCYRFKDEVN
jgi:hypothetical protein